MADDTHSVTTDRRIRARDMFMLMALWMERFPIAKPPIFQPQSRPTGCVIVDPRERLLVLECTGESHAIVRALLRSDAELLGTDVYVSRMPCSLCVKVMVQAGIRKIYYFPAAHWELDVEDHPDHRRLSFHVADCPRPQLDRKEKNFTAIQRLIMNNSIAMSMYIPQWSEHESDGLDHAAIEANYESIPEAYRWTLDPAIQSLPNIETRWNAVQTKFKRTIVSLYELHLKYHQVDSEHWHKGIQADINLTDPIYSHAIVMAHIAAKRTDDPKVGVGAVLLREKGDDRKYISVGWNGFPRKAQHLDYPHAGADDAAEDDKLKYDYILHAEQNALLWRNPKGCPLQDVTCIVTKTPCDECSPMLHDCGIRCCYVNRQIPKSPNDPSRLRGLSYEKVHKLMEDVNIFVLDH